MLEKLVKHQAKLLQVAYNFTGDLDSANDILQDAYIKIHESGKKYEDVNDAYIYFTIKSVWIDTKKKSLTKNRIVLVDDFADIIQENDKPIEFEIKNLTKWEQLLIDAIFGKVITNENNEIVKVIKGTSISNLSKKTGIEYSILYRGLKKIKHKIWLKD